MEIGKPQRTKRIEPVKLPIPEREPVEPEPKRIPRREPTRPERAPTREPVKT